MPLKHKLYYLLAGLHLLMVGLYAAHLAEWGPANSKAFRAASAAGDFTGSNNIFSFFAPGLSNQPYVIYTLKDSSGGEKLVDLAGSSPDFSNRITDIYGFLTIEESRPLLSMCLAQLMMKQHRTAKSLRVSMIVQYIPSMKQYRGGERSAWRFWFNTDYERKK